MMRLWNVRVFGLVLTGLLCGAVGARAAAADPNAAAKAAASAKPAAEDPNKPETIVVARIGDYTINKAQLLERVAMAVAPQREKEGEPNQVVKVPEVLDRMLAEKAMMIEGRKLGYLEHKDIKPQIDRYRMRNLIGLMLEDYVRDNLNVTDAEIQAQQKTDPNLTVEQAKRRVQNAKVNPLLDQFYAQLLEKHQVKKLPENFTKASQAHQRLLTQPVKRDKNIFWITGPQIEEELTPEEKTLVLATYDTKSFTLTDWLNVLNEMAPPGRPKNLDRVEGVNAFTDRALQGPVLMAEAIARGYDKNAKHLESMRPVEDNNLMGKLLSDKLGNQPEPNESVVQAYYEKHKDRFGTFASMTIDQIWCKDLATAQEVRKKLAAGAAFDAVKKEMSLRQEDPHDVWPTSECIFWDDLRKAEPNTVVGPVKGFFEQMLIKWRVVKVLGKKPAVPPESYEKVKNGVKEACMMDRSAALQRDLEKQMLAKYPHEVYADKIKDIDPLAVSTDSAPAR